MALAVVLATALSACGLMQPRPREPAVKGAAFVTPFSAGTPGAAFPNGWYPAALPSFRRITHYELVEDNGTTVARAYAENSSSGMVHDVDFDLRAMPVVRWRWKVTRPVAGADNTRREGNDAAARLEFAFHNDKAQLPFNERLFFSQVKALAGIDVPYATLEYVWGDGAAPGTVIINTWTSRIRILMIRSGTERVGEWVSEERNLYEDFKLVFGEEPGKLTHVGVYTDADATGSAGEAYYGDIVFVPASAPAQ